MEEQNKENWLSSFMRRVWWTYLVIGGMLIGFAFGTFNTQAEAVANDAAYYNPKTKELMWGSIKYSNPQFNSIKDECMKMTNEKRAKDSRCTVVGIVLDASGDK